MWDRRNLVVLVSLAWLFCASSLRAQCTGHWLPTGEETMTYEMSVDAVSAIARLANGNIVVGQTGSTLVNYLWQWDGSSHWSHLGETADTTFSDVTAMAVLPNGDLVVAASFTTTPATRAPVKLKRWNGTAWSEMGSGSWVVVNALLVMPNGDLIAGGGFNFIDCGVHFNHIARWDGANWSPLGDGLDSDVHSLAVMPNGDLVAGGYFYVAHWNGSVWSSLGTGLDSVVYALAALPNGDVVAGGSFGSAGGVEAFRVAKWNGTNWSAVGTGMDAPVHALAVLPSGDVVAGGYFKVTGIGGHPLPYLAIWNGVEWSTLGTAPPTTGNDHGPPVGALLTLPNGDLIAGGNFTSVGGIAALTVARWDGSSWSPLGMAMNEIVNAVASLPNGDLVVGGFFTAAHGGDLATGGIARWDGTSWWPFGSGTAGGVESLAVSPSGTLYAGGYFSSISGVHAASIARWDGTGWSPVGAGLSDTYNTVCCTEVDAIAILPNGNLVAAGGFNLAGGMAANGIAQWDGSSWSSLGLGLQSTYNGSTYSQPGFALAVLPDGDLIVGGQFTMAGSVAASGIARWDGSSWHALGDGLGDNPTVYALSVLPNGDLIAGGSSFDIAGSTSPQSVARWNGTSWLGMGSARWNIEPYDFAGTVKVLCQRSNGDLVAGGNFTSMDGERANYVARWDGTSWSSFGNGVNGWSPGSNDVRAIVELPNSDLFVGGYFETADEMPSQFWARWSVRDGVPVPPSIVSQPVSAHSCTDAPATFSASVGGTGPFSYRWQVLNGGDWINVHDGPFQFGDTVIGQCQGSATRELTVADVQQCPKLSIKFRCAVSNACGTTNSDPAARIVNSADFNGDGDIGTDADIESFFACLAGACCASCGTSDFNCDGDVGTDADIEEFFRVLAGGNC
jgi:hypothetical protein